MAFLAGFNKGVVWTPTGVNPGTVTLDVTEHSWSEQVDFLDVTHSGTGGVQAALAGILRGDGNVKANSDDTQVLSSIFIAAGATGVLGFYHYVATGITVNPSFSVGALITQVNYKVVVAGVCSYDFNIKLNIIAGSYQGGATSTPR